MAQGRNNFRKPPRSRVLGTGLIALDLVVSRQAAATTHHYAGGTCGNVLAILSFLDWDAYPVSRLNGDFTSHWVLADLKRWGVHTDFASLAPTGPVPVIIEWITEDKQGRPSHRYSFVCPTCGSRKPAHKPVLASAVEQLLPTIEPVDVFFFDRVSRASVLLARHCRDAGAMVVFEPSGVGDPKLFSEALGLTHILKYSNDRMGSVIGKYARKNISLEIETSGEAGLRFRSRLKNYDSQGWVRLEAVPIPKLNDAAGAGDWLTAALLDRVARSGSESFLKTGKKPLHAALRFAQAAAAWNCGFEAPRGGMYSRRSAVDFENEVRAILSGVALYDDANKMTQAQQTTPVNGACLKCRGIRLATRSQTAKSSSLLLKRVHGDAIANFDRR